MIKAYEINYIHALDFANRNLKALSDFGMFGAGIASLQGPVNFESVPLPDRNFSILWFILHGRITLECGGRKIEAGPGSLVLRCPHEKYRTAFLDSSFDHVYFHIQHPYTDTMQCRPAVHLHEIHTLTNMLYYEDVEKKPGHESNLTHLSLPLLNLLQRNLEENSNHRIEPVFRILEQHPKQIWTTAKLAARLHISSSLLYKLCRQYYGKSPSEIIQSVKMRHVNSLLLSTDESLDSIAEQLGYSSAFALSKIYHKYYGKRPGGARRELQSGK